MTAPGRNGPALRVVGIDALRKRILGAALKAKREAEAHHDIDRRMYCEGQEHGLKAALRMMEEAMARETETEPPAIGISERFECEPGPNRGRTKCMLRALFARRAAERKQLEREAAPLCHDCGDPLGEPSIPGEPECSERHGPNEESEEDRLS